jgi:hypothetical protein
MYMDSTQVAYAGWQPVRIDLGYGGSAPGSHGFFINSTGLQWNSSSGSSTASNQFNGWVVCDWWHGESTTLRGDLYIHDTITDSSFSFVTGVPQLFFRLAGFNTPLPESCADVYLKVEYIEA